MRAAALFYPLGEVRKNLKSSADGPFHSSDMSARDIWLVQPSYSPLLYSGWGSLDQSAHEYSHLFLHKEHAAATARVHGCQGKDPSGTRGAIRRGIITDYQMLICWMIGCLRLS